MRRAVLVLAALLVACSADHAAVTGVMLEISGPSSTQRATVSLRVRVSSGPPDGELVERGDETVDVSGWPAEVFVRAEDVSRVWSADVWALDEDDEIIGSVSATGVFWAGEVPVAPLHLDPATEQEAGDAGKSDGGDATRDAGSNGSAPDAAAISKDAAIDARAAAMADAGQATPRDAGVDSVVVADASTRDADAVDASPKDAGLPDAAPLPCADTNARYVGTLQGTLRRPGETTISLPLSFTLIPWLTQDTLAFAGSGVNGMDSTGVHFQATLGAMLSAATGAAKSAEIFVDNVTAENVIKGSATSYCADRTLSGSWSYAAPDGSESGNGTWSATAQ